MTKIKKGLAISMALVVLTTSTMVTTAFADSNNISTRMLATAKNGVNNKGNGKAIGKELKITKNSLEKENAVFESQKEKLEEQKESLEKQYKAAEESGDTAKATEIKKQIEQINASMKTLKEKIKQNKEEIKANIKANYTNEELKNLESVSNKIKKNNKNVTVLPVENLIVRGVNVKFDTPPVIKSGRTLIPVKALSEAFGAKVQWIAAEKKVIITKGDTEIVLTLDSNKIYVNGVEKTLDVPACSLNGRTVVPLKFIVEQLGLKVTWDKDTKDIEIEAQTPTTPTTTTTGSAIEVTTSSAIEVTATDGK